jgi:hypothetical protein
METFFIQIELLPAKMPSPVAPASAPSTPRAQMIRPRDTPPPIGERVYEEANFVIETPVKRPRLVHPDPM